VQQRIALTVAVGPAKNSAEMSSTACGGESQTRIAKYTKHF